MPSRAFLARLLVATFLLAVLLSGDAHAESASVRLRWRASPDASVVGYNVHVRPFGGAYGAPRDVGAPPTLPDGTISLVIGRLDPHTGYAFALSAYTASGAESVLSNELNLVSHRVRCRKDADCADADACTDNERCEGGRCVTDPHVCPTANACTEAMCDATQGCLTHEMPDGASCTDGDPCVSGTCAAGTCVISDEAQALTGTHDLMASQFKLKPHRSGRLLAALGSFAVQGFEPRATGVVVQILRPDGGVVFQADVRGRALRRSGRRRWGWVPTRHAPGLRRLSLRWDGVLADVRLKAVLPSTAAASALTWAVHTSGICVRAPDLVCTEAGPRLATCS